MFQSEQAVPGPSVICPLADLLEIRYTVVTMRMICVLAAVVVISLVSGCQKEIKEVQLDTPAGLEAQQVSA